MATNQEIERRRTFAIIAHPDAGKTSLTEKLLLFGGQIQVAGAVKSNKIKKTATSDWMDIEKQRGISVTTSVMEFDYKDYKVNILDTPGHQDFAEDTYRTLTAVDSVIIVVDGAKGVETQTRKLMEVCRMRNTPVIIFVNKMDREAKDPFDLLDELEEELHIHVRPLTWPIESGVRFKGVYNIYEQNLNLFQPSKQVVTEKVAVDIHTEELDQRIGTDLADRLRSELELIEGVYPEFNVDDYLKAEVAPVFFGSALNNFGVEELLNCFVEIAPSPRPVKAEERDVQPDEPKFTGFIFKITANIDPNHRSCIAFCKVCSGKFSRNTPYYHVRHDKVMRFSSPTQFMAQRKTTVDEAWAGDIIGLPDNGTFKIGDTLTEGEKLHFRGLPSFSPEVQRAQDYRHRGPAPVRGHPVPPGERVQRQVPLGTREPLQGLLDRERRPCRARSLQEAQVPVHGQGPRGARRLPGRLGLRAPDGADGLQAHQVPLHERVLTPSAEIGQIQKACFAWII